MQQIYDELEIDKQNNDKNDTKQLEDDNNVEQNKRPIRWLIDCL